VRLQRAHSQRIEIGFASSSASPVLFVRAVSTRISIDIEREAHVDASTPLFRRTRQRIVLRCQEAINGFQQTE
jgi:hypothetical protein